MIRQFRPALVALLVFTVALGVIYPLAMTGLAQVAFGQKADGSAVRVDGEVVGSSLVAQPFEGEEWFQPRPSAADYDAAASSGSNLGPTNAELLATIEERADTYLERNRLAPGTRVPVDAVTASGSGLDPHISVRNARLQAPRVAAIRDVDPGEVRALVEDHVEGRSLSILGEPRVNVVELNAALTRLAR